MGEKSNNYPKCSLRYLMSAAQIVRPRPKIFVSLEILVSKKIMGPKILTAPEMSLFGGQSSVFGPKNIF